PAPPSLRHDREKARNPRSPRLQPFRQKRTPRKVRGHRELADSADDASAKSALGPPIWWHFELPAPKGTAEAARLRASLMNPVPYPPPERTGTVPIVKNV